MGLLDFDDEEILRSRPVFKRRTREEVRREEDHLDENFGALQTLGHEENSADFSDSMFADRRKKCESCLAGFSKEDIRGNCTCV